MIRKLLRSALVTVLAAAFLLQVRSAWTDYRKPLPEPLRPINWTEEQEDYIGPPDRPQRTIPLGGPLSAAGLLLPPEQREASFAELIAATRSTEPLTLRQALLGIRRVNDPQACPRLYELLQTSLADSTLNPVKKQLVWTVGVISPPGEAARWQPLLERLLSDADPVVRDYTAFALARLGVPRGAELSLAALLDHNRKPITRGRAALALADGKFKAYAPQLQQILQEKPPCDLANRVQRAIDRMTTAR